jgi:hypothetical protein
VKALDDFAHEQSDDETRLLDALPTLDTAAALVPE